MSNPSANPPNRFRLAPKESQTPTFPVAGPIASHLIVTAVEGSFPLDAQTEDAIAVLGPISVDGVRAAALSTSGYDYQELNELESEVPAQPPGPSIDRTPMAVPIEAMAPKRPTPMAGYGPILGAGTPLTTPRVVTNTLHTKFVLGPNPNKPAAPPAPAIAVKPVQSTPAPGKPIVQTPVAAKPVPAPPATSAPRMLKPSAPPAAAAAAASATTPKPAAPAQPVSSQPAVTVRSAPPQAAPAQPASPKPAAPAQKPAAAAATAAPAPAPPAQTPRPAPATQTAQPQKANPPAAAPPAPQKPVPVPEKPAVQPEKPKINVRPSPAAQPAPPPSNRPATPAAAPVRPAMAARDRGGNALPVERREPEAAPAPSQKSKVQPIRKNEPALSQSPAASHDVPMLGMPDTGAAFWTNASATMKAAMLAAGALVIFGGGYFLFRTSPGTPGTASASTVTGPSATITEQTAPNMVIGGAGWAANWGADAPVNRGKQISLFRPTMSMTDYRFEFRGQIEQKALGWIVRAANSKNYYVLKIEMIKRGLSPVFALVKYPVIDGKETTHTQIMLNGDYRIDQLWNIRTDVKGSKIITYVQEKLADYWTDDQVKTGGAGFYIDKGERAQIKSSQFSYLPAGK